MNAYTIKNAKNAVVTVERAGAKVRIIANIAAANHISWPIAPDEQTAAITNVHGKLYSNVADFAAEHNIELNALLEDAADDTEEVVEQTEEAATITEEATATPIVLNENRPYVSHEELRRTLRIAAIQQQRAVTAFFTGTITTGKYRKAKGKDWLAEDTTVVGAAISKVANKWIFLTRDTEELFAKEVTNATYTIR